MKVGAVSYVYQISTYEVTVAQYVTFLNAVAASDPYGLYHSEMSEPGMEGGAIIERYGTAGAYTYATVTGKENQPVRIVNFYDGIRLANWLHNGQGSGDTATGAYNLSLGGWVTREPGALWPWLPRTNGTRRRTTILSRELIGNIQWRDSIEEPTDQTTPREMNLVLILIGR